MFVENTFASKADCGTCSFTFLIVKRTLLAFVSNLSTDAFQPRAI
jgi:hypothetical protein